jgi:hypothetical protein
MQLNATGKFHYRKVYRDTYAKPILYRTTKYTSLFYETNGSVSSACLGTLLVIQGRRLEWGHTRVKPPSSPNCLNLSILKAKKSNVYEPAQVDYSKNKNIKGE